MAQNQQPSFTIPWITIPSETVETLIQFKVASDYTRAGRDIREHTRATFYTIACGK